jgi:hypothetical protein
VNIKEKVARALEEIERQARASEREAHDDVSNSMARMGFLGEARGLKASPRCELRRFFKAGDLEPLPGPREILAVLWGPAEAQGAADFEAGRVFGGPKGGARTNVRVVHEKIRAESTWRWGWVVVADARKEGT